MEDGWDKTISNCVVNTPVDGGIGCLLQIHPLEISGNLIELKAPEMSIGRDTSCGLCIADTSVSRKHALIERVGMTYHVTDLDSTNGTCVNEVRVALSPLTPGDRIQFGSYIYKFMSTNHIEMQYHEAVYSMITRDGLTGILNKRSFLDIIQREFRRAVSRETALSLIMFDVDDFKRVNDTYGHLAGDDVLKEIGRRISDVVADHDIFVRFGGEEFAILIPDADVQEAYRLAECCRLIIQSEPFATCVGDVPITVSLGVADVASLTEKVDNTELIHAADACLYEAKQSGRNRVCI